MASTVLMPKMGASMEQAMIVKWLVKEGDRVQKGDLVAEIETDKVNLQIETFASGFVRKVLASEGEMVPVGRAIAIVGSLDEPLPEMEQVVPGSSSLPSRQVVVEAVAPGSVVGSVARAHVSPVARKIAALAGVDPNTLPGSGPGGRVVRADVERAVQARLTVDSRAEPRIVPRDAQDSALPVSRMRRAIGQQMTLSKQTVPHFYITMAVDMGEAGRLRAGLNELLLPEQRVTINDFVVAAAARALREFPQVNASYNDDQVILRSRVHIGIAIAVEDGLLVPVVRDADARDLRAIAVTTKRLADGARKGLLPLEDYSDATFTVTNLGMFGAESFLAIINPPEAAILAVGAVESVAVGVDGRIVLAERMRLTLSGDHRLLDGAVGARFLQGIKARLEKPLALLIQVTSHGTESVGS